MAGGIFQREPGRGEKPNAITLYFLAETLLIMRGLDNLESYLLTLIVIVIIASGCLS